MHSGSWGGTEVVLETPQEEVANSATDDVDDAADLDYVPGQSTAVDYLGDDFNIDLDMDLD